MTLPALRDRLDEMAHHIVAELAATAPGLARAGEAGLETSHASTLAGERPRAAKAASATPRAVPSPRGQIACGPSICRPRQDNPSAPPAVATEGGARPYVRHGQELTREAVEQALAEHDGNVSRAARSLGLQRTTTSIAEIARHALDRSGKRR